MPIFAYNEHDSDEGHITKLFLGSNSLFNPPSALLLPLISLLTKTFIYSNGYYKIHYYLFFRFRWQPLQCTLNVDATIHLKRQKQEIQKNNIFKS